MHSYSDLLDRAARFNLTALKQAQSKAIGRLHTSARTSDVKVLQMVALQRAIMAIGMFSLTESIFQDNDSDKGGFEVIRGYLDNSDAVELKHRFLDFKDAINVLKHGHGSSYNRLLQRSQKLPFRIKQLDERFFREGDVSDAHASFGPHLLMPRR